MKPKEKKSQFENEAALCRAFISAIPEGWTAYPETGGFDILLVRGVDGAQIGIEAKLSLNAKVLVQAAESLYCRWGGDKGPDFRAVLVPNGTAGHDLSHLASFFGIPVITCREPIDIDALVAEEVAEYTKAGLTISDTSIRYLRSRYVDTNPVFEPKLPEIGRWSDSGWKDHCPVSRLPVPEFVPDVTAGASGPSKLSEWKIKAIKICIILERRGFVTAQDFKTISIDRKRWLDMRWIAPRDGFRGHYIKGKHSLDLRKAHPVNFGQIEESYEKWAPAETPALEPLA